jgi:hypothetical protein
MDGASALDRRFKGEVFHSQTAKAWLPDELGYTTPTAIRQ